MRESALENIRRSQEIQDSVRLEDRRVPLPDWTLGIDSFPKRRDGKTEEAIPSLRRARPDPSVTDIGG